MAYHRLALAVLLVATSSEAFSPAALPSSRANANANALMRMVAVTPADLGIDVNNNSNKQDDGEKNSGAMMDLTGIVFSVSDV